MIKANGSLLFLRREFVAGIALRVDRTYLGGQFACGDGVTEDYKISYIGWYKGSRTHVWWQYDRWRRLLQITNMEWLALHADIYRLQWVQSELHGRLLRLWRCWLSSHPHL